jgi:hypothetical protein
MKAWKSARFGSWVVLLVDNPRDYLQCRKQIDGAVALIGAFQPLNDLAAAGLYVAARSFSV